MKKRIVASISSLKLTVALLIIIAAASILGTVIPQKYGMGGVPGNISPELVNIFESLQLFDLYHSVWFIVLMSLLSINLIACSLQRLPASWKLFKKTPSLDTDRPFQNLPAEQIMTFQETPQQLLRKVEPFFRRKYRRVRKKHTPKGTVLYGEKGAYSRFGVYVTHASVLVVIAGAVIGSLVGFDAYVNLGEGESTDSVYLARQGGSKQLDFTVRCDEFSITYYDNGMPKEYRSELSFFKNDTVIFQGPLLVNHPLTIDGIRFYQASYGTLPEEKVDLTIRKGNGEIVSRQVRAKEPFFLNDRNMSVTVVRIEENFMSMGPAVLLEITSAEDSTSIWVFKYIDKITQRFPGILQKVPKFNPGLVRPYRFGLDRIESRYYTGIQVSKDPGVYTVAVGSLLVIVGFFITFFSAHRRLWIRIDEQEGQSKLSIAASSTKDPVGLNREVNHLVKHISSLRD
ncbi:MAG: cytochrome c biogenesis protein ResB [Thermodesulfobacteriota bacterium]